MYLEYLFCVNTYIHVHVSYMITDSGKREIQLTDWLQVIECYPIQVVECYPTQVVECYTIQVHHVVECYPIHIFECYPIQVVECYPLKSPVYKCGSFHSIYFLWCWGNI